MANITVSHRWQWFLSQKRYDDPICQYLPFKGSGILLCLKWTWKWIKNQQTNTCFVLLHSREEFWVYKAFSKEAIIQYFFFHKTIWKNPCPKEERSLFCPCQLSEHMNFPPGFPSRHLFWCWEGTSREQLEPPEDLLALCAVPRDPGWQAAAAAEPRERAAQGRLFCSTSACERAMDPIFYSPSLAMAAALRKNKPLILHAVASK